MAGVRVISSLAVFLFLLLASFSAAREGRAARTTWTPVTDRKDAAYLALVKTGEETCAGSIPSKSTVLTYCTHASTTSKAYAGLLDVAQATTPTGDVQVRAVNSVAQYSNTELKICVVSDWELNDHVATVPLNLKEDSKPPTAPKCTVLGFRAGTGSNIVAHKMEQAIGDGKPCGLQETSPQLWYSKPAADNEKIAAPDRGGPAVCDKVQWGINIECKKVGTDANDPECNTYVNIFHYSKWIEEQKNGESGASGGTGGNSTSPSSGYSIHSYLNKYSNWKVLGFLVPTIVTFLQY